MNQGKNFAVDLRRISYWLHGGQIKLARKMLSKTKIMYAELDKKIGCFENIWDEIGKINSLEDGRLKASERALTLSTIIFNHS
jgi:hypothetical protein